MRNPYPRPRRVPPRGSFITLDTSTPRPAEPPSVALVPPPEPTFRFELERGLEDRYNFQRFWADSVAVTVTAATQGEACEKAQKLSGDGPANKRYLYIFRTRSVSEV